MDFWDFGFRQSGEGLDLGSVWLSRIKGMQGSAGSDGLWDLGFRRFSGM